jgi:hypothetical protein
MSDHQKIHPVAHDVEAPHTPRAPLVPPGTTKSDGAEQYPPLRRTIPVTHAKPPKRRRSCCCRCFCWTISLLLLLVIIIGAVIGILYLVFQPKLPKFSIDKLQVTQFTTGTDDSLNSTFDVTVTARNPNKKIGIYYEDGSQISGWYTGTKLCEGALPKFYQGHRNTTVLILSLTGQTQNATGLVSELQQQQQETGNIPIDIKGNQPVRVKLGKLKLFEVKFKVSCRLLVDAISANNEITIQSSSCKFRLRL